MKQKELHSILTFFKCYPIYFPYEDRLDIFQDGYSLGYVGLTNEGEYSLYGAHVMGYACAECVLQYAMTPIAEREYDENLKGWLEEEKSWTL